MTSPCESLTCALTHLSRQRSNSRGSITLKTRPKVSWEGTPWGNSKKLLQPFLLHIAKSLHHGAPFGSADHCAQADDDNVDQSMSYTTVNPRIGQIGKAINQRRDRNFRGHWGSLEEPGFLTSYRSY